MILYTDPIKEWKLWSMCCSTVLLLERRHFARKLKEMDELMSQREICGGKDSFQELSKFANLDLKKKDQKHSECLRIYKTIYSLV